MVKNSTERNEILKQSKLCRQEGWRLEHEDIDDQSSPIIFKGVVFNEMKGAFVSSLDLSGGSLKPIIDNLDTINAIILAPRLAVKIKLFVQNVGDGTNVESVFNYVNYHISF